MSQDKKTITSISGVTGSAGASGKTVSNIQVYRHGCTLVVEMNWTDTTQSFIKFREFKAEVGGNNEFGSGTAVHLD